MDVGGATLGLNELHAWLDDHKPCDKCKSRAYTEYCDTCYINYMELVQVMPAVSDLLDTLAVALGYEQDATGYTPYDIIKLADEINTYMREAIG